MLSYKSILAKPAPLPEPKIEIPIENSIKDVKGKHITQKHKQMESTQMQSEKKTSEKTSEMTNEKTNDNKDINPIRQRIIHPRYKSPYTKKETIKWLYYKIDHGIFHYDYCSRMFELLRKWIKINRFSITTSEEVLFGRFISLMYLLSSKRNYIDSH